MNAVITTDQAKNITGGRQPLTFPEYEVAIGALEACCNLDEMKYFRDWASAAETWGRIHRADDVTRLAKRLKGHAMRRMGECARLARPAKFRYEKGKHGNQMAGKGAKQLLMNEGGMTSTDAQRALVLARIPKAEFENVMNVARPPAISTLAATYNRSEWYAWYTRAQWSSFYGAICASSPINTARLVATDSVEGIRKKTIEMMEWLDAFEQALPK